MTLQPASRPGVAWLRVSDLRGLGVAVVSATLAVGVPVTAAMLVAQRTDALAAQLGAAAGVEARIGSIDADLTGTLRLSGVALGTLFAAERIEASVALESLLSGQLAADEIRVAGPRIAVEVDRDGDSDLARIVRRLAEHRRPGSAHGSRTARVRRVVVSSGTMTARIAGLGEIAADDVELVPDAGGVRVVTGKLRVRGASGTVRGELALARGAAELALPRVTFGRLLAVAGTGSVTIGDRTVVLREVALGRLAAGGVLEARGLFDDHGVPRPIGVDLVPPRDGAGFAVAMHGDRVPLGPFAALAPHHVRLDGARASGRLIVRKHDRMVQLDVDGSVSGLRFDHETLAPQPIPVDADLTGMLVVTPDAIAVQQVAVGVGAARWTANGWLRRHSPVTGQLDIQLQPAPCNDLLASLPGELRGVLDGLTMSGTFGGRARLALDLAAPTGEGVELATTFANACVVAAEPPAADVASLTTTREHVFPDGSRALVGEDQASHFPLRRLPSFVVGAFVSAEDARFFDHRGFDVTQIARSFEIDLRDRRLARGGSTISQQLVKNAFLTQRRSLDRKIQEAILTWRLEARLDKKAILDRYLNIIELGPRVFGIRAAANHWFGLSPRELTIRHAAFLAALTSEPTTMSRRIRNFGGLDPDSAARVDTILRAMTRNGFITKEERDAAREAPLHFAATALRRES